MDLLGGPFHFWQNTGKTENSLLRAELLKSSNDFYSDTLRLTAGNIHRIFSPFVLSPCHCEQSVCSVLLAPRVPELALHEPTQGKAKRTASEQSLSCRFLLGQHHSVPIRSGLRRATVGDAEEPHQLLADWNRW